MRESLICIGRTGSLPYCFKETGVRVSSYEEICYYVSQHMICYLYTLPEADLAQYIEEELGLERLAHALRRYNQPEVDQEKYFTTLFRAGNYFTEEESRKIIEDYRRLKSASVIRQCKLLGDLLFSYGKTAAAIACYHQGLKYTPDNEVERGNLYHNLGVAQLKLFHFKEAKTAFVKAFRANGNRESFFYYYVSVALEFDEEEARKAVRKFEGGDYLASAFEQRFRELGYKFYDSNTASRLNKIRYASEHGREGASVKMAKNLVKQLQQEFREEQGTIEHLTKMMKQD